MYGCRICTCFSWRQIFMDIEALRKRFNVETIGEEFKVYTSTKEMFRDMGFDVSNIPDD